MSREETTTSDYLEQIRKLGINPAKVHRNLEASKLVSHSVSNGDGKIASTGSLAVKTGKYTGRSPDDRFIVKDNLTKDTVDWGKINHPIAPDKFDGIFERLKQHLEGKDLYIFDGFVGADPETRLPIRVINDHAWQNLFARQLFIRPTEIESASHVPEFNLVCINDFEAVPEDDGTNSNVFIMIDPESDLLNHAHHHRQDCVLDQLRVSSCPFQRVQRKVPYVHQIQRLKNNASGVCYVAAG